MIPATIVITGDTTRGQDFIGQGKRQMDILERLMSFQSLNEDHRTVVLEPGVTVECWKSFSQRIIHIHVNPPKGGGKEVVPYVELKDCYCGCNFATGFISRIGEELETDVQLYDVIICNTGNLYIGYTDILASDFTEYQVGQPVVVMAYNTFDYLCCSPPRDVMGCSPVVSALPTSNESWRTAYRILPICGRSMKRWYNRRLVKDVRV